MIKVDKVEIFNIKKINNPNGDIHKLLNNSDKSFNGFGEIYTSSIHYNSIKAWKCHKENKLNLFVLSGKVKFVFYDLTNFLEIILDSENLQMISLPPNLWFGFQGLKKPSSLILSISNHLHSEDEIVRKEINEILHNWKIV